MPFVTTSDAQLYFEVHGEGLPIVFAHGVGGNHASWFNQIETLSGRYQVITIDQRGFGLSTDPAGLGRASFVSDLKAVLDHLDVAQATIVGQSMGGSTAAAFTCTYPERVAALVLADTLAGYAGEDDTKDRIIALFAQTRDWPQSERVLGARFRKTQPALTRLYSQIASFNSYNIRTTPGAPARWTAGALAATGKPVMFIVGQEDVMFPPDLVRGVQSRIPAARMIEIPESGHSAFFEMPDAFNSALLSFLGDIGYASPPAP